MYIIALAHWLNSAPIAFLPYIAQSISLWWWTTGGGSIGYLFNAVQQSSSILLSQSFMCCCSLSLLLSVQLAHVQPVCVLRVVYCLIMPATVCISALLVPSSVNCNPIVEWTVRICPQLDAQIHTRTLIRSIIYS